MTSTPRHKGIGRLQEHREADSASWEGLDKGPGSRENVDIGKQGRHFQNTEAVRKMVFPKLIVKDACEGNT